MNRIRVLLFRFLALFRRRKLEQELEEELEFHLRQEIEHQMAQGFRPEEARRIALRRFGRLDEAKETYRDARGIHFLEILLQDIRYALRALRKSPSFTLVAVLSLALGIGANSAMFTIVNGALLRMLPVKDPDQLVSLATYRQQRPQGGISYPIFRAIAARQQTLSEMAASGSMRLTHVIFNGAELQQLNAIRGAYVSANYFSFLGLAPAVGRFFTPSDSAAPGEGAVAVVGYDLWERALGRDPGVIGKDIVLDGVALTIVGVAPGDFIGDRQGASFDIWVPMLMQPRFGRSALEQRTATWFRALGRLKPDVAASQANAELTLLYQQDIASAGDYTGNLEELRVEAQPFGGGLLPQEVEAVWQPMRILLAMVGLVLLIACCNVANLLLARGSARRREIGIRMAVGSSRRRLVAQLMTESLLLSLIGGAVGYAATVAGTRALAGVSTGIVPATLDLRPDARVLALTAVVSLAAGIVFGLIPAIQTTSVNLDPALRSSSRGHSNSRPRQRTTRILVVAQVGLSLWLLVGAGLMLQTLRNLRAQDMGVDRRHVISLFVSPEPSVRPSDYPELRNKIAERLKLLPGVQFVSFAGQGLFSSGIVTAPVRVPESNVDPAKDFGLRESWVSPEFFQTVGLKLTLGRALSPEDARSRVGVINEVVARFYFGGENPLGKWIYFPRIDAENRYIPFASQLDKEQGIEIVGVVRDTKESLKAAAIRMVYMPIEHRPQFADALYVRTAGDEDLYRARILQILRDFNHDLAVTSIAGLDEWAERSMGEERLLARLLTIFGLLALVLAAVGLFGVMAYAVVRRTGEMGIRMALGAQASSVVGMVLRETLALAMAGIALGIPAAAASSKILTRFLFGLKPTDPLTIAAASGILLAVALMAGYAPARRASKVDPLVALRHD